MAINVNYLNIVDSSADTLLTAWVATNSTDGGNNSGWTFGNIITGSSMTSGFSILWMFGNGEFL